MQRLIPLILFICSFFYTTSVEAAPLLTATISESVSITSDPIYPGVGEETRLTFNTYGVNTVGGTFFWYIDGVQQTALDGQTSITLPAIDFNESKHVIATFSGPAGTLSQEYIYSPVAVDIIIEPDTAAPAFYRGRSPLAAESTFTASAIFHTSKPQDRAYSYEWRLGTSLPEIKKGQRVTFSAPIFSETLFVTIKDAQGKVVIEQATTIEPKDPTLLIYALSPSLGFIPHAIMGSFTPSDDTTTFVAHRFGSKNTEVNPAWSVANTFVDTSGANPYSLTLSNLLTSSNAAISFSATYGTYGEKSLLSSFTIAKP